MTSQSEQQHKHSVHEAAPCGQVPSAFTVAAPLENAPRAEGSAHKTRDAALILHFLTPQQMAEEIVRLDTAIGILSRVTSLKTYDANKGRSNAGRRFTVNVPAALWNEARELVSTLTDSQAKVPGRSEVARNVLVRMDAVRSAEDLAYAAMLNLFYENAHRGGEDDNLLPYEQQPRAIQQAWRAIRARYEPSASGADTRSTHCEPSQYGERPDEQEHRSMNKEQTQ